LWINTTIRSAGSGKKSGRRAEFPSSIEVANPRQIRRFFIARAFFGKSDKHTMAAIASSGDFQVQFYQINLQNSHVALQQKIARLCVFNRLL
jgi:hypothetical protein